MQWEECEFVQLSIRSKKNMHVFGSVKFFPICFADNNTIRPSKKMAWWQGTLKRWLNFPLLSILVTCTITLPLIPHQLDCAKCQGLLGKRGRTMWHLFPQYFHVFPQCSVYWMNTVPTSGILWEKLFCERWGRIFFLEGSRDFWWFVCCLFLSFSSRWVWNSPLNFSCLPLQLRHGSQLGVFFN